MRKCNYCDRTISEFSTVCPYCHKPIDAVMDEQSTEQARIMKISKIKKLVIVSLVVPCVLNLLWRILIRFIPLFPYAYFFDFLSLLCVVYGLFVILKYKIVSFSKNKMAILVSSIVGVLAMILNILKLRRLAGVELSQIIDVYNLIEILIFGISVAIVVIDIYYLISRKVRSNKNEM